MEYSFFKVIVFVVLVFVVLVFEALVFEVGSHLEYLVIVAPSPYISAFFVQEAATLRQLVESRTVSPVWHQWYLKSALL